MLMKFEVENFKSFKERIILNLEKQSNYEFNSHLIKNDVVRAGIIFGENASGKSNLGLAIFDLVEHLTDKEKGFQRHYHYLNLNSDKNYAEFKYVFKFDEHYVEYYYKKIDSSHLLEEYLFIDQELIIQYDYQSFKGLCKLNGAENLNTKLENNSLSFVKYIYLNTVLSDDIQNFVFKKFMSFVNNMLLFYSVEQNHYQGFYNGTESLASGIIQRNKLKECEEFLHSLGIHYHLISKTIDNQSKIYVKFKNGEADLSSVASTGTKSLILFYYWLIQMDTVSLVFIDEFDAFYHFELSYKIVEYITKNMNVQVLFTSHNTNLMTNELLRPDCYFNLQNHKIESFSNLTIKELRKAHNLQKMYKAGAFNEKV